MKIAAIVVLYYPEKNFEQNILSYYEYIDRIFVFDNTEKCSNDTKLKTFSKIEYYHDSRNEGIAKRLNQGCAKAIEQNYEWIMTMDQDSFFLKETADVYFNCFKNFEEKNITAQFGIRHSVNEKKSSGCQWEISDDLITSASIVSLNLYQKIGIFDENFFIDSIDHDYCIRVMLAGYQNVLFTHIFLKHEMGTKVHRASFKSLFLLKKHKEIYSPLRCYYKLRNVLYLEKKFSKYKLPAVERIKNDVHRQIKECLFYGRQFFKIKRYLHRAEQDFCQNKMGKMQE